MPCHVTRPKLHEDALGACGAAPSNPDGVVVAIERRVPHPVYGKMVTRTTRLKAHDEANSAKQGDTVRIAETRPLSRDKRWRVVEIVERAR